MDIAKQTQLFAHYKQAYPEGPPGLWVGGPPDPWQGDKTRMVADILDKTVSHTRIHVFCREECRGDFVTALRTLHTDPAGVVRSPFPQNWINRHTRCHQCGRVLWWHLVGEKHESGETQKAP